MAFYLLLQNTPTQNQVDGSLQSELMPVQTSSPQTPPTEHIAQPPSTVDTAALNEEPMPGEGHCLGLKSSSQISKFNFLHEDNNDQHAASFIDGKYH